MTQVSDTMLDIDTTAFDWFVRQVADTVDTLAYSRILPGYIHAPYIPRQVSPQFVDPNDFALRKGIRDRPNDAPMGAISNTTGAAWIERSHVIDGLVDQLVKNLAAAPAGIQSANRVEIAATVDAAFIVLLDLGTIEVSGTLVRPIPLLDALARASE